MAREKDFDLRAALAKPSFTPGQRDIGALVALITTDEAAAVRASPALAKLGAAARAEILGAIGTTKRTIDDRIAGTSGGIDNGGAETSGPIEDSGAANGRIE
ncbi:MAG: hypothetical protein ACKV2T_30635, partial [Kofleriaceae bacterium]